MIIPEAEEYQLDVVQGGFYLAEGTTLECPDCHCRLRKFGRRRRTFKDRDGAVHTITIQRLRCCSRNCGRVHHLLPHDLIPYKRYRSKHIEAALSQKADAVSCETSTKNRWQNWLDDLFRALERIDRLRTVESGQRQQLVLAGQLLDRQRRGWLYWVIRNVVKINPHWRNPQSLY